MFYFGLNYGHIVAFTIFTVFYAELARMKLRNRFMGMLLHIHSAGNMNVTKSMAINLTADISV